MGNPWKLEKFWKRSCCWLVNHMKYSNLVLINIITVRSMMERYPEKSFMRILQVETLPNEVSFNLS